MGSLLKVVSNKKHKNLFGSDIQKPIFSNGFLKKVAINFSKTAFPCNKKYTWKKIQQILNVNLIIICV
jgi:hypothetical protein